MVRLSTSGVGEASCGGWFGRRCRCRPGAMEGDWYIELVAGRQPV